MSGVGRRGGEFIEADLQDAADLEAVVNGACNEIMALGTGRKSWLVFCTGIRHAEHVRDALPRAACSRSGLRRDAAGRARADHRIVSSWTDTALVNVMVLTTGFDVPQVDLVAMLRPTLSTGLYVQQIGRGTRKAPGKGDCLVLDFAGNVMRHGPVDLIDVNNIKTKSDTRVEPGAVRAKECPDCHELNSINAQACTCCGYEWPRPAPKPRHATAADVGPILSGQMAWLPVDDISFICTENITIRSRRPACALNTCVGFRRYAEYISLERQGYARTCAEKWWFAMGALAPVPATVPEAVARRDEIDGPVEIAIVRNGKFWNVSERRVQRPDGSVVEIDRHFHCWTLNSRAESAAAPPPPINDEIVW